MIIDSPRFIPTHPNIVELDRLGDEIAELSAHLDAATAHLLDLVREFDARGGWNNGFRSCAVALLARGVRAGRGPGARPGGARARDAAAAGARARAGGAVLRQGA